MSRSFDIQSLINGDMTQLELFKQPIGERSIYIEWVPDEMTKEIATEFFNQIGKVSAVDFIKQRTGKARMMFVHFDNFDKPYMGHVNEIASVHPNAYEIPIQIYGKNPQYAKSYNLRCRINMKPIQRVEYNPAQLTDMTDRLRKELDDLKQEVADLKTKLAVSNA
jgi:hypothetical protein